jgi:hypothetical protein
MLVVKNARYPCPKLMLVFTISAKILCMPKMKVVFTAHDHLSILDHFLVDTLTDHKHKYVQFGIVYHFLMQYGRLMINYKNLKPLL